MRSTLLTKSITDLTRRKARAFFAVLTLAIAVASVGIFAASSLMDQAMQEEVQASRLADLTLQTKPLALTLAQLEALGRLPNVTGVQPLSVVQTRVWIGDRRQKAIVVGVPSYARQPVDRVTITTGTAPQEGTVLTDIQKRRAAAATTAGWVTRSPLSAWETASTSCALAVSAATSSGASSVPTATLSSSMRRPRLQRSWPARQATACSPSGSPTPRPWPRTAPRTRCAGTCARRRPSRASLTCPQSASPAVTRERSSSSSSRHS